MVFFNILFFVVFSPDQIIEKCKMVFFFFLNLIQQAVLFVKTNSKSVSLIFKDHHFKSHLSTYTY
jgi:hypothetical protein